VSPTEYHQVSLALARLEEQFSAHARQQNERWDRTNATLERIDTRFEQGAVIMDSHGDRLDVLESRMDKRERNERALWKWATGILTMLGVAWLGRKLGIGG
jgi:hypothetical protein